jgi:hypothetical protein
MARLHWVIVCERAILEEQARTVSLMSVVENIQIPRPPKSAGPDGSPIFIPFRFYVVNQWGRANPKIGERLSSRIRLLAPSGKQYGSSEFLVDLVAAPKARVICQAIGFPLEGAGTYRCVVEAKVRTKWRKAGDTEFSVTFLDGAKAPRGSKPH